MQRTDLRKLFGNLQSELLASLRGGRALPHSGVQGVVTEESWIRMLRKHLPRRYAVSRAIVIDSTSETSEQIDVVIHDQQYSPLLFKRGQQVFVPAESVYAVFEVKPRLDARNLHSAAKKAKSVRRLHRTNAPIPHAGGVVDEPKKPFEIIAGILCDDSGWSPPFGEAFVKHLHRCRDQQRLDLGCALRHGSFRPAIDQVGGITVEASPGETALVSFFVALLHELQACGTVPAIDYKTYGKIITDPPPPKQA